MTRAPLFRISVVALAATTLGLAACSGGGSTGGSTAGGSAGGALVIARASDALSMDKTTTFDNNSIYVMEQIMEPLFTVSEDGSEGRAVARDRLRRSRPTSSPTRSTCARA